MKKYILIFSVLMALGLMSSTNKADEDILKTSLQVFIRNEMGNLVEGAKVTLYKSEDDYNASTNPVQEAQLTDAKGRVIFRDLDAIIYFIHAEKDGKNNHGMGIQTETLQNGKVNKVTIMID